MEALEKYGKRGQIWVPGRFEKHVERKVVDISEMVGWFGMHGYFGCRAWSN